MEIEHISPEISTTWIENLAIEELNMDESGIINFGEHINSQQRLEESSIELMDLLRDKFEFFISKFNELRSSIDQTSQIRIFKISNTVNDFMLFRNSLRLIIARKDYKIISIGFLSGSGEIFSPSIERDGHSDKNHGPQEIYAEIGPFNKITWKFQDQEIEIDSLVRFYLSEFVRYSAR